MEETNLENNAPWCSGSTPHFDCDGVGSNPAGAVSSWFESSYPSYVYSWKLYTEILAECCLDKEISSFKECVAMLWRYTHTARKESVIIYYKHKQQFILYDIKI